MFFVKKKIFILKTKLLLWWWCPFLEDSGRTFGLINSPSERVTRSHHGSQVSLFLSTFIFFHFPLLKLVQLWNAQILVTFVINFLYGLSIYQLNTLTSPQLPPLQHYNITFLLSQIPFSYLGQSTVLSIQGFQSLLYPCDRPSSHP